MDSTETIELRSKKPTTYGLSQARAYQQRFIYDDSRFVSFVASRQIGKSWAMGGRAGYRAYRFAVDQVMMSRGQRQATRLLEKVHMHLKAFDLVAREKYGTPSIIKRATSERIDLNNGAVIQAVPCDTDTTVGDAADVNIDEYGLFPNSDAIYEALTPSIMNGFSITVVSSPRGRKDMFSKICLDPNNGWSKHRVTLYDAERDGLRLVDQKGRYITAEEFLNDLRRSGMSELAIRQEFLCEFIDEATAYIPMELIERLQDSTLSTMVDWKALADPKRTFYVGIDVGRKHDLTCVWIWEVIEPDKDDSNRDAMKICRGMLIMQGIPFGEQEKEVARILSCKSVVKAAVDCTGMGMQFAENLTEKFGAHRVEGVTFTMASKNTIAGKLRAEAEKENLRIPDDRAVTNDWYSIETSVTDGGNIKIGASRTADGHADRFWAAALGLHAIDEKPFELAMGFASDGGNSLRVGGEGIW